MPNLNFKNENPGIVQAMTDYPATAKPMNELAELLLRTDEELTRGERELIAAHVSKLNHCFFCSNCHLNVSLQHHKLPPRLIDPLRDDVTDGIEVRPVVKALLNVAGKVQQSGTMVTAGDISAAKELGATDRMIHDTVLIAAAFCMYNRYVDGLATLKPIDPNVYFGIGKMLAEKGYFNAIS
jgi:uncharacterized peroxidase-related enzyme